MSDCACPPDVTVVIGSRAEAEEMLRSPEAATFTHWFCATDATDHFANQNLVPPEGWDKAPGKTWTWKFDDVDRIVDGYVAVNLGQGQEMVKAFQEIKAELDHKPAKVWFNCYAGISRSTAMAYIFLCTVLGPGKEEEAIKWVKRIRVETFPNGRLTEIGDRLLERKGVLADVAERFRDNVIREERRGGYGW